MTGKAQYVYELLEEPAKYANKYIGISAPDQDIIVSILMDKHVPFDIDKP